MMDPDLHEMSEREIERRIMEVFHEEVSTELVVMPETGLTTSIKVVFASDIPILASKVVYGAPKEGNDG